MGFGRVCRLGLRPGRVKYGFREGMSVRATSWPIRVCHSLCTLCRKRLVKTSPTDGLAGRGKSACILFMFS